MGRAKPFPNFPLQFYEPGHCTSKFSALQKTLPQEKKSPQTNKQSWNSVCISVYILKYLSMSFSTRNSESLIFNETMFKTRIKNL